MQASETTANLPNFDWLRVRTPGELNCTVQRDTPVNQVEHANIKTLKRTCVDVVRQRVHSIIFIKQRGSPLLLRGVWRGDRGFVTVKPATTCQPVLRQRRQHTEATTLR
jgi:hypothetical protein